VIDEKEAKRVKLVTQDKGPRCPTCAAFPQLARSFLDPRTGRTIRLFECRCGERIWDE
jgi:hypothetical protein